MVSTISLRQRLGIFDPVITLAQADNAKPGDKPPEKPSDKPAAGGNISRQTRNKPWKLVLPTNVSLVFDANFAGGASLPESGQNGDYPKKVILGDPGPQLASWDVGLGEDDQYSISRIRTSSLSGARVKLDAKGQIPLGDILGGPTTLSYRGIYAWEYIDGRSSTFDSMGEAWLTSPYAVGKLWVRYRGFNLLGLNPFGSESTVPDKSMLSTANTDTRDMMAFGTKIGVPINKIGMTPYLGFEAEGAEVNYFQLLPEYLFKGDAGWIFGTDFNWGGYRGSLEYFMGTEYEEMAVNSSNQSAFSNLSGRIQDAVKRPITMIRGKVETPEFGNTRIILGGDWKDTDNGIITQYDIFMRLIYMEKYDLGLTYRSIPVPAMGDNTRITLDAQIPVWRDWSVVPSLSWDTIGNNKPIFSYGFGLHIPITIPWGREPGNPPVFTEDKPK